MGQIAAILILTDFVGEIRRGSDVGAELERVATGHQPSRQWAKRVALYHSSESILLALRGYSGKPVCEAPAPSEASEVEMLRAFALRLGYDLVKR